MTSLLFATDRREISKLDIAMKVAILHEIWTDMMFMI